MKDDRQDQRRVFGGGLPASLAVHVLIVALLIFGLPVSLHQPEEEQAIKVDLVPPPKPPEKAKAAPPPPQEKAEKPREAKVEKPPPAKNDANRNTPSPVLAPVFQFGDKDAGPRKALDGNSAKDGSASSETPDEPAKPDKQEPSQPPAMAANGSKNPVSQPPTPTPKPAQSAKAQQAPKPEKAKKLASREATGDIIATTAMGELPRGVRAGRLCVTELREQLRNALPPYFPDLLPSYRLDEGTVLDAPKAAFRMNGAWYNLSYRCEIDTGATKVVDFAFRVGGRVPPAEWERRGLPAQ